jgi:hypothetical protein
MLDGKRVTTHWGLADILGERYPKVRWQPEQFVTEDGRLFCSGGSTPRSTSVSIWSKNSAVTKSHFSAPNRSCSACHAAGSLDIQSYNCPVRTALGDDDVEREQRLKPTAQCITLCETDRNHRQTKAIDVPMQDANAGFPVRHERLLAQRLARTLKDPFDIGASIGTAVAPMDGVDADQLLKKADMALYAAKNGGGGDHRFFALEMEVAAQEGRALELDLREALTSEQFQLYFQPLVDLRNGRVRPAKH